MSDEELVKLIQQGIDVKNNMELLYKQCYGYIKWVAKKYIGYVDIDDLMQDGYIALNNAVYDYNANISKFTTCLYMYLVKQFDTVYRGNSRLGKLAHHYNEYMQRYFKLQKYFKATYDRNPTIEEYVAYLRLSIDMIKKIEQTIRDRSVVSIDCPIDEDEDKLTLGMTLSSNNNTENEVVNKIMEDDLKNGLWEIVKDTVNDDEYNVVYSVYKFNMPLEKYSGQFDMSRRVATNNFYSALGKLRTQKVKNKIADRFEINYARAYKTGLNRFKNSFTSATEDVAIKNIENELNYIAYVLTAAYDGINLLSKNQVKLALEHGLIDEDYQVCTKWETPNRGIAGEEIEQYDIDGSLIKQWISVKEASVSTGITISDIRRCAKGTRKTAGGFVWKKVSEELISV